MTMTPYFPIADALTAREREPTSLVSVGLSNKEIVQHLNVRRNGDNSLAQHFRKLRVKNRMAALVALQGI
jgi:DNA-binding CsgD family transcriptional regulator